MSDLRQAKAALRKDIREKARTFATDERDFGRSPLTGFLKKQSGTWGAFFPFQNEPPILGVLAQSSHLKWVFPRTGPNGISFHHCATEDLEPSAFGVREPSATAQEVSPAQLDGALIPGLAFDRQGMRLGRGKGYYDRFLETWQGYKIGAVWSFGLVDHVPTEEHDVKVDAVATEDEMILLRRPGN